MSYNFSYFLETIPMGFDGWNWTERLDVYQSRLQGFLQIDEWVQEKVAVEMNTGSLWGILFMMQGIVRDDPKAVENNWNATWLALQYFINPDLFTPPPPEDSECDDLEDEDSKYMLYVLPGAIFMITLLSLLTTRKSLWQSCCWKRPGLAYPINFLDERSRRWAYMSAFALLSYRVLVLFEGNYFWKPDKFDDADWMKTFGWTKVFVGIINIGILGLVYYPLIAAISMRRYLLANIIGIFYSIVWAYNHINVWVVCPMDDMEGSAFFEAIFQAPMLLFIGLVLLSFILDLGLNVNAMVTRKSPVSARSLLYRVDMRDVKAPIFHKGRGNTLAVIYVKGLLKRKPLPPPTSLMQALKRKLSYRVITGYKYSPRLLCTMIVALLVIYKLCAFFGVIVEYFASMGYDLIKDNEETFEDNNQTDLFNMIEDGILVARYSFMTGNIMSSILQVLTMVHIMLTHRSNITKLYRGDRSWHFKSAASPASTMVASMRYSGYQIAFLIYGYFLMLMILFVVSAAIGYLVVIPIINGTFTSSFLFNIIKTFWPTIIVGLVINIAQILLAKLFFLQEKGRYLAIENRRMYHVFMFFFFFFNVILGLFSCLKRILFSMVFGVMMISRLDRCLLMRGFEQFDTGFRAYLGMCQVDLYHTHPVLVAFAEIMREVAARKAHEREDTDIEKVAEANKEHCRRQRIRNKWWKCVTMANNPTILIDLLHQEVKKGRSLGNRVGDTAVDQLGNVATAFVAGAALGGVSAIDNATTDITIF